MCKKSLKNIFKQNVFKNAKSIKTNPIRRPKNLYQRGAEFGIRTRPLADADPQNLLDPRTLVDENLRTRTESWHIRATVRMLLYTTVIPTTAV